jgi:hypothetical protein
MPEKRMTAVSRAFRDADDAREVVDHGVEAEEGADAAADAGPHFHPPCPIPLAPTH